jgi:hypothetical protein
MADFSTKTEVHTSAVIKFTEAELRALDALIGYGVDPFLKVFYEKLGKAYMQPHEQGLRKLFKTLRQPVGKAIHDVDEARRVLTRAAESEGVQLRAAARAATGMTPRLEALAQWHVDHNALQPTEAESIEQMEALAQLAKREAGTPMDVSTKPRIDECEGMHPGTHR